MGLAWISVLEAARMPDRSVSGGVARTGAAVLRVAAPVTISRGGPRGYGGDLVYPVACRSPARSRYGP